MAARLLGLLTLAVNTAVDIWAKLVTFDPAYSSDHRSDFDARSNMTSVSKLFSSDVPREVFS
jgi:hypothetical protein